MGEVPCQTHTPPKIFLHVSSARTAVPVLVSKVARRNLTFILWNWLLEGGEKGKKKF